MRTQTFTGETQSLRSAFNPINMARSLWLHRELLSQFVVREIQNRYRGMHLGIVWSFITPLAMLGIYTFVFGVVFKARWPMSDGTDGGLGAFALAIFSGSVTFLIFSETLNRASMAIVGVPNFVKKVVFPVEIIPISLVGCAAFHAFIGVLAVCVGNLIVHGTIPWTTALFPIAVIPIVLIALGSGWIVSAIGVYLRDLGQGMSVVVSILSFATPIFYPISAIPLEYQYIARLNPLTAMVDVPRSCLLVGQEISVTLWLESTVIGILFAIIGFGCFRLLRKGFADVL